MDEKFKEFIENTSYDVVTAKEIYNNYLKNIKDSSSKLDGNPSFYVDYLSIKAPEAHLAYLKYQTKLSMLSRFAHFLGDEYVELMNSILEGC